MREREAVATAPMKKEKPPVEAASKNFQNEPEFTPIRTLNPTQVSEAGIRGAKVALHLASSASHVTSDASRGELGNLAAALAPLIERVRTDVSWVKLKDGRQFRSDDALTDASLLKHLNGGPARGVVPMQPGTAATLVALLDFDSHKGETAWADMRTAALRVTRVLRARGGAPVAFRSSGGKGVHLCLLWDAPQDAYSVRRWLEAALIEAGFENGPAGVSRGQVEVFPKQDEVKPGKFGNQFILPLAGASVPLDPFDLDDLPREWIVGMNWPMSAPVPVLERPAPVVHEAGETPSSNKVRSALAAIPDGSDFLEKYDAWLSIVHAIHSGTGGSPDGLALAHEFSQRSTTYDPDEVDDKWARAIVDREGGITVRTLYKAASGHNWVEPPDPDDFAVLDAAPGSPDDACPLEFVDFGTLVHTLPPAREWVVDQWLPRKAVTSMFGRGGHGKSLLAQQLAICVANAIPFLDSGVQRGNVLGLFAEDDSDELLRRAAGVCAALGLEPGQGSEQLHLDARAGKFNTLVSFTPDHMAKPTRLMASLRKQCDVLRPTLVILDNIAQLFAGQENARHEVTAFCNELTAIARQFDCAVLLLGHTAKIDESEYSGSTAWDAAVRSRLLLARQDDGSTLLRKAKANYSALDELRLEYRSGAFVALPSASDAGPEAIDAIKPIIVRALEVLTKRKQAASHIPTARNYLVRLMVGEKDLAGSIRADMLQAALRAMLDAGEVIPAAELPWKSPSRHAVTGLAIGTPLAEVES